MAAEKMTSWMGDVSWLIVMREAMSIESRGPITASRVGRADSLAFKWSKITTMLAIAYTSKKGMGMKLRLILVFAEIDTLELPPPEFVIMVSHVLLIGL